MEWKAELIVHRDKKRIAVWFENKMEHIARVKKLKDARWSKTLVAWHLSDTVENRLRFKIIVPNTLHLDKKEQIEKFRIFLQVKRYSESTIKTYTEALKVFFTFYKDKNVNAINNQDVESFHHQYIIKNNLSSSFQNQIINAITLYFKSIKNTQLEIEKIYRPKRENTAYNSKFAQKWLTVVYVNSFVNYLVQ